MLNKHRRYEKVGDMSDSLLTSLYSRLDPRTIGIVADSLDISDESSLKGFQLGIMAILAGVVTKGRDEDVLRTVLALSPSVPWGDISLARFATETFNPDSLSISVGKRILSIIFGDLQKVVIKAVAVTSGIEADAASTILTMAASMVVSIIANRVRTEGLSMHDLQGLLQSESDSIQNVMPSGLEYLLRPAAGGASQVRLDVLQRRRPADRLRPLTLIALMPFVLWFFSHARKVDIRAVGPVQSQLKTLGGSSRAVTTEPSISGVADRTDSDPVDVVQHLLVNKVNLRFDTGSATLGDGLRKQLDLITETMAAYPDVHLTLTGHTDNTGDAAGNRRLARRRANTVMAELIRKGVAPDHLSSETESTPSAIGDNFTEENRAKNRCVTLEVSPH